MEAYKRLLWRVGVFFTLVGIFLFVLFVSSDMAKTPDFDYLFLSLLAFGVGWLFNRGKPQATGAGRFAWLNKQREAAKKRKLDQKSNEKK
jgi:hypothetical protein